MLSFSGLPQSGMSAAIECLRTNYVEKNVFKKVTKESEIPEAEGIIFYEMVAANFNIVRNPIVNEFTAESSFAPVILSAFKEGFLTEGKITTVPLFDEPSKALLSNISEFKQPDLDEHLCFIYQYLSQQDFVATDSQQSDEEMKKAQFLLKSLPEGIAIVNVWDVTISESLHHFLAALQGHLYNHHMWLFLDLERDLDNLDKPPGIVENSTVLMDRRPRPRLHYLLRSCKLSEDKKKERRRVCTIFAMHKAESTEANEKIKIIGR